MTTWTQKVEAANVELKIEVDLQGNIHLKSAPSAKAVFGSEFVIPANQIDLFAGQVRRAVEMSKLATRKED